MRVSVRDCLDWVSMWACLWGIVLSYLMLRDSAHHGFNIPEAEDLNCEWKS